MSPSRISPSRSPHPPRDRARAPLSVGIALCCALLWLPRAAGAGDFRVLSWNVSGDPLRIDAPALRGIVRWAEPDVLLLDEVAPGVDLEAVRDLLAAEGGEWYLSLGQSGGRQRGLIASRWPLEELPELSGFLPYPDGAAERLEPRMREGDPQWDLGLGLPLHAAAIRIAGRSLLVAVFDLQCCGNSPGSWQEERRRIEAREIRRRLREVVDRRSPDGVVLGGDFNLIASALPLIIASGPYGGLRGLTPAEAYHRDESRAWTWDGRETPYASRPLDFQLHSSVSLVAAVGRVLDSEELSAEEQERFGLSQDGVWRLSDHLPVVVDYSWLPDLP